ncbi:2-polyprenyl-6-methoxyphenol hydroxylase-like FAD-dependent oxidoreductase [Tamaricihabitans halophyticus]|uniref:2-polyprenyl-6-methoxyphenol hydroxylase-like FAD-dependent oxidoreductase n=1 Tax=Tamaricihabitans halophyticus TaxID=1262583 RepID=A0A4R2R5S8_9PSEU|nr:FAD-dependent monooxygenase [Tamaricihabitans halophyticus]TCP57169.1 2-polyprenyl-6-methoxyphenol hydroxylase-like FAD-dependent oxidoreductase [Tamaricihabitans halophyticus]
MRIDERVPVLIVGAGLAGAATAMFLGLHGVPALLVERHPGTSNQPKARGQSWHTMEALRIAGVADQVRDAGYDVDLGMPIVIAESVAGRRFHEILGEKWPDFSHLTRERMAMASQERAEPILLGRARELGVEVRFETLVESVTQDADGVTAVLRQADGAQRTVRADYLVAADGWRGAIRESLGIGTHGRGELNHSHSVVFEAELGDLLEGREFALFYLQNPEMDGGGGAFVSTDDPGRYAVMFGHEVASAERFESFSDDDCVEQIRLAVGIPDLPVRILSRASTGLAHRVADRLSEGRVHLVGDAAQTMPPHGGQGGNTAILDGFHLAWKLAGVVAGWAGAGLLDSHDTERRPYGELIAGQQYANMIARSKPELADGTEDEILPAEWTLFGYRCAAGAVVPDSTEDGALVEDPATSFGRPGSRAPHVWLTEDVSTMDHFGKGFVLLTANPAWQRAAESAAEQLGVPLTAVLLPDGDWRTAYGLSPAGATLVRPDRFVAWRSVDDGTATDLAGALKTVLFRS